MATIKGWGQEISQFDPNKYGGVKDLGLYIDYHTNNKGLSAVHNNGIFKVGDTYYFVTSGNGNTKLTKNLVNALFKNYNNKDNVMYANDKGSYSKLDPGLIIKITDPTLIQSIEANANESRGYREKIATANVGATGIDLDKPLNQNTNVQNTQQETKTTTSSGGGSSYNPYIDELKAQLNTQNNTINELKKQVEEANRVYTGEELAEHYGIKDTLFSRDYWNKLYTDYVNEMYDDLVNQQTEYRDRFTRNNSTYDDYLEKEYMNSYNNASNARATRGAIAANALSTGNVNDYNSSKNDISMLQNVNALEALRQAGLADVANKAEQAAVNNRKVLMQLGAKHNTSDVLDATNDLNAAATIYGADRNYLSGVANAARAKYGGLINAAGSKANSQYEQLYNYYMSAFNGNESKASSYLTNFFGVDPKVGV